MSKQKNFLFVFFLMFCLIFSSFGTVEAKISRNKPIHESTESTQVTENEKSDSKEIKEPEPVYQEDFSKYLTGEGVTMIGDSIMNGNRSIILNELPDANIDAKGSRDVCGGFEAAQRLDWEGNLTDVVIVELGTNGPLLNHEPYASGTQNLLELLGTERKIFWVTVYCSYSQWMNMNNEYIWQLAAERPNIKVIDWYSLSIQHPEWFPDGVHPTVEGARNFARLLREALEDEFGGATPQVIYGNENQNEF